MSEWDTVISIIGTLGGIVIGCFLTLLVESRRQKYEKEAAYRKELLKHTDDLIKPLFAHIEALWGDIAVLQASMVNKSPIVKGKTVEDLLENTKTVFQELKDFIQLKYTEMSFLFPHQLSPWVFMTIHEHIENNVILPISNGQKPMNDMTLAVNVLMKYQKNLRNLLGYETKVKLEHIYPFEKKNS